VYTEQDLAVQNGNPGYSALDTHLDRFVVSKVLPPDEFAEAFRSS